MATLTENAAIAITLINQERDRIEGDVSTYVVPNGTRYINNYAFYGEIMNSFPNIPSSVTEIGISAFGRFNYIDNTTWQSYNATIPGNVLTLGSYAFYMSTGLRNLYLENGVEKIGTFAFGECKNLSKVYLPKSINYIDSYAVANCSNLRDVYYAGTQAEWANVYKGTNIFPPRVTIHYEYSPSQEVEE